MKNLLRIKKRTILLNLALGSVRTATIAQASTGDLPPPGRKATLVVNCFTPPIFPNTEILGADEMWKTEVWNGHAETDLGGIGRRFEAAILEDWTDQLCGIDHGGRLKMSFWPG